MAAIEAEIASALMNSLRFINSPFLLD
jgi:hypothetical protein